MSRAILAGLVALLGLSTGAAFATNDFLAGQAATQAAFLGGSTKLAAEGGSGGTPQGSTSGGGGKMGSGSSQTGGTKSPGAGTGGGGGCSGCTSGRDPDKTGTGPGSTRGGDKNPGARSPSNPGAGGDPTGKDSTPGGQGTNPGNTPGAGGGCSGGGGCDSGAQQAQRDKEAAAQKAAERTQNYANDLSNYNRDRQSSPAEIKAAKEAAEARLSQAKTPTPKYTGAAMGKLAPQDRIAPSQGVNTYTSKMSDIVGNPTTYDANTTPEQRQKTVDRISGDYTSQNDATERAIARANLGIGTDTYTDPTYGKVTIEPAAQVEPGEPMEYGDFFVDPYGIHIAVDEVDYDKVLDALAGTQYETGFVRVDPVTNKPTGIVGRVTAAAPKETLKPSTINTRAINDLKESPEVSFNTKDPNAKETAKPSLSLSDAKADGESAKGAKPEVNRTPPGNAQQPSAKDPKETNAVAAQKAAENASKVATAKAEQSSRALGGFGNVPQGAQPAKKEQAPAKQQQPSKVATNPKTSPNGQGTGGEGGGGIGDSGRTQGTDGKGTRDQGDGKDGGTSPKGNGQGDNPNGQGGGTGNTDNPGQGDSDSTGTDTDSPNGSNGIEGGVNDGQGTGNGTGDTDSQGTDSDGEDTGEGSGDANGDDSDGNETGSGGGGTTEPRPNLTDRIAQLTQPKIGSFFARLFEGEDPSENVEEAPPMTEEEFEEGPKLEGAFTAIGQPDEESESESDEEEGEGEEEAETPAERDPRPLYRDNMAVGPDDPIWDKVHPDLKRDKDRILAEGKIRTGALIAADAVFRHAEKKGVPMHVAVGGGADNHSENHLAGPKGAKVGESIDISPGGREITKADVPWSKFKADPVEYAKIATAAIQLLDDGKARIGVPLNRKNGLHVQDTGNQGLNKPAMSWVYGKDTIGAGRKGKKGGFRSQLQSGAIKEQFAGEVTSLYAPVTVVVRKPKEKTVPELPKTVADIPKVVEKAKAIEVKVQAALENPTILKVDGTKFQMPEWTKGVKLDGGGNAQTGQADAKQPETKQPETPQPGTTRSLSSEELLNQVQNNAETEAEQPAKPKPATKIVTKTKIEDSLLKSAFDAMNKQLKDGTLTHAKAFPLAKAAAREAGTELSFDEVDTLRKNPNLKVVYETNMSLGEMKQYMTPEQLAQIPTLFGKQLIPDSTRFDVGVAVPKETLTAKVTREVEVPADTPVQTLVDQPVPATDEEGTTPETPSTGLVAEEQPLPPGATPETTWKFTVKDENGDTVAHVEKQRKDGSINLEGGVIGQPVTIEPDGPQTVTIGRIQKVVTFDNGRATSIKDAPVVSPESEPETETDTPADVPAPENPVKKAVKAVVSTVKSIFNFIFGDGKGGETNNQPGMGGNGTSTRNE